MIEKDKTYFIGDNSCLRDKYKDEIKKADNIIKNKNNLIKFAHRSSESNNGEFCNVRSHGWFLSRLFKESNGNEKEAIRLPKEEIDNAPNNKLDVYEFIEAILSRVIIFDNRVFKRFPKDENQNILKHYNDQLNLSVFAEDEDNFDTFLNKEEKSDHNLNINFLVIHLSFIESLNYKGGEINNFINEKIEPICSKNPKMILVITTGRGRDEWWEKLNEEYRLFTIFKPIESILSAIETGISYKDDIDIKFNLIKVLFGS